MAALCSRFALLLTVVSLACASLSGAQGPGVFEVTDREIRPSLLRGSADGRPTVGLGFDLGAEYRFWSSDSPDFRKTAFLSGETMGMLALHAERNPDPIRARLGAGSNLHLYWINPAYGREAPDEPPVYDYGMLVGRLAVGYETDQPLDEQTLTFGGEVGYRHLDSVGVWAIVPIITIGYEGVRVLRSELRRDVRVEEEGTYPRLRFSALWKASVGQWLRAEVLAPLDAHFRLDYFHEGNQPAAVRREVDDDFVAVSGGLSYAFREPLWGWVSGWYLKVSDGRTPPQRNESTTVYLGLNMARR